MKQGLSTIVCMQHLTKSGPASIWHLEVSDYFDTDKLLVIYASQGSQPKQTVITLSVQGLQRTGVENILLGYMKWERHFHLNGRDIPQPYGAPQSTNCS